MTGPPESLVIIVQPGVGGHPRTKEDHVKKPEEDGHAVGPGQGEIGTGEKQLPLSLTLFEMMFVL